MPREISTIVFQLNEKNGKFEGEGLTASEQLSRKVGSAIVDSAKEVEIAPTDAPLENTASTQVPPQKPPVVIDDGKAHSWMLQLGSFKTEDNAIKLRDSLRTKQYVTNVDERKFSSGSVWRVRVGPFLNKNKVLKIQKILEKETGMKGLIVRRR